MSRGLSFQVQHQGVICLLSRLDLQIPYLLNLYFKDKVKFHFENLTKAKSYEHLVFI